jgi:hypothetical protein
MEKSNGLDACSQGIEGTCIDRAKLQLWDCAKVSWFITGEGIGERLTDLLFDRTLAVQWHGMPQSKRKQADIIEAKQVVGMSVSIDHRMHQLDSFPEQLRPQIRRSVDQQISLRQTE